MAACQPPATTAFSACRAGSWQVSTCLSLPDLDRYGCNCVTGFIPGLTCYKVGAISIHVQHTYIHNIIYTHYVILVSIPIHVYLSSVTMHVRLDYLSCIYTHACIWLSVSVHVYIYICVCRYATHRHIYLTNIGVCHYILIIYWYRYHDTDDHVYSPK